MEKNIKQQKDEINNLIFNEFSVSPEFLFIKFPDISVFRHKNNKKWFAIIMSVQQNKLGFQGNEKVDLLNIKLSPLEIDLLKNQPGFLPAYHMNKKHWLSIKLNNTLSSKMILELIERSFELTKAKK